MTAAAPPLPADALLDRICSRLRVADRAWLNFCLYDVLGAAPGGPVGPDQAAGLTLFALCLPARVFAPDAAAVVKAAGELLAAAGRGEPAEVVAAGGPADPFAPRYFGWRDPRGWYEARRRRFVPELPADPVVCLRLDLAAAVRRVAADA